MSTPWDGLLSAEEQQVFEAFTWQKPLGARPALLIIDVNYAFVGLKPQNIVESVADYRTSCGERGWAGVANIQVLLSGARASGIPVVYTTLINGGRRGARWAARARDEASRAILSPAELEHQRIGNTIVAEIAPRAGEIVIEKRGASAFFGTPLLSYLNELDIDTVLLGGTTTSGCVRATAVDAACNNFYVGVVEECCFDRFDISHRVSLMDMHAKYGQVLSLEAAQEYLQKAQAMLASEAALALT